MSIAVITGSREARMILDRVAGARQVAWSGDGAALRGARAVIDASHPCEAGTHRDLAMICAASGLPLARFRRAAWQPEAGDRWIRVPDAQAAREALDTGWRRVFLCLSGAEREPFAGDVTRWFLVRSQRADRGSEKLRLFAFTGKDGSIDTASEIALMLSEGIDALVTRNAGGAGALPKIEAARKLGIPVILIERPPVATPEFSEIADLQAWLDTLPAS